MAERWHRPGFNILHANKQMDNRKLMEQKDGSASKGTRCQEQQPELSLTWWEGIGCS